MISGRLTRRDSLLFVYGTLRPFAEVPMARWLASVARHVGVATTTGRLFDLGRYPGMRAARAAREVVIGDVYRIADPRVLRVLDRYEAGAERRKPRFVRERCVVTLARGRRRAAWAYVYRYGVVNASRIVSGDYRAHCSGYRR